MKALRLLRPVAPLAGGLLALACGTPARPLAPATSMLRIGHEGDVMTLDPLAVAEATTHSVLSNIYEPLVTFDRDMRLVPALAVSWQAPDERTWLFKLRGNARFHDGRVVAASDVHFALERARSDPGSGVRGQLSTVEAVEEVDSLTVKVTTRGPDPLLLNRLSYVLIAPKASSPGPAAAGTGPYRILRWDPGRSLDVEAFTDYWNGRPPIDRVRFLPLQETDQVLAALRLGQVDVVRWLSEQRIREFEGLPGIRVASRPGLSSYYLWIDSRPRPVGDRNPFADKRVRHALSLALDRKEIVRRLGGRGVVADQLVQQGVFGYISTLPPLGFDPDQARRLLKLAGHPKGFEVSMSHRPGEAVAGLAGMVRDMLGAVGIQVTLVSPPWPEMMSAWDAGRLPFFLASVDTQNRPLMDTSKPAIK